MCYYWTHQLFIIHLIPSIIFILPLSINHVCLYVSVCGYTWINQIYADGLFNAVGRNKCGCWVWYIKPRWLWGVQKSDYLSRLIQTSFFPPHLLITPVHRGMSQYFKEPDTRPSKLPSRSSLPVLGGRRRLVNRTSRFTSNAETKTTLPEPSLSQRTIDQTPTPSSLPANTATHSLHDPTTTDRLQVALPPNTTTNNSDAIERCLKGVVVYLDIR